MTDTAKPDDTYPPDPLWDAAFRSAKRLRADMETEREHDTAKPEAGEGRVREQCPLGDACEFAWLEHSSHTYDDAQSRAEPSAPPVQRPTEARYSDMEITDALIACTDMRVDERREITLYLAEHAEQAGEGLQDVCRHGYVGNCPACRPMFYFDPEPSAPPRAEGEDVVLRAALDKFRAEMENHVIPEIVAIVRERERAAITSRNMLCSPLPADATIEEVVRANAATTASLTAEIARLTDALARVRKEVNEATRCSRRYVISMIIDDALDLGGA